MSRPSRYTWITRASSNLRNSAEANSRDPPERSTHTSWPNREPGTFDLGLRVEACISDDGEAAFAVMRAFAEDVMPRAVRLAASRSDPVADPECAAP